MEISNKIKNWILAISIFSLMLAFMVYNFAREKRENNLLENSKQKIAVIVDIDEGNTHSPPSGDFKYKVGNKEYKFNQSGDYEFMQIGDTVLIEYAVEDHSVARVVDKYYMQKYKKMKKK